MSWDLRRQGIFGQNYGLSGIFTAQLCAGGKNSLVIAIGCTGGKHRSVTLANALADRLKHTEYGCKVEHRDIDKDTKRKK